MGRALRDHYLRIDARSLGLFRLSFGALLILDLFRRWRWIREFYSNEGVLPNHNHLFNLRETGQVWSVYHAFSTAGENHLAFAVTLLFYIAFFIGWKTRAFHALSLACLVSLTARNILLENAGSYAAIAVLAFTLFLPCGSRFSVDSLRASLKLRDEKTASDLNHRPTPSEDVITALHLPGWTPTSLAALAVLVQIAVIYLCLALQHDGAPWRDGSAMHYALHVNRFASGIGTAAGTALPPAALRALTYLLYVAEWAIPVLIFLPVIRRAARVSAFVLMVIYGLVFGLFFSFGLFGWTLVAAAPLVLSSESWEAIARSWNPRRARTVVYDADCGICLLISRTLKRMDLRGHLTFQGNDDLESLLVARPGRIIVKAELPKELTPELVLTTVVAVDQEGRVFTRSRALAETLQALPLGWAVAWVFRMPGISSLADALYNKVVVHRHEISAMLGLGACGITPPSVRKAEEDASFEVAPSTRVRRGITGGLREIAVLAVFAAMLAQTGQANHLPQALTLPQGKALQAIAAWPRMLAKWDILTPAPPLEDGAYVVDGQTKGGRSIDPLTGRVPVFDPDAEHVKLGQLWNDYLDRIRQKEWSAFQKSFRDYLAKGGPSLRGEPPENQLTGYDAYWITSPSPPPGGARPAGEPQREKLFTHSRGGRLGLDKFSPVLRPDARRQ